MLSVSGSIEGARLWVNGMREQVLIDQKLE